MTTFAKRYRKEIINLSQEQLEDALDIRYDKIAYLQERLRIICNEKKVHDTHVAIHKCKIEIREIKKLLNEKSENKLPSEGDNK